MGLVLHACVFVSVLTYVAAASHKLPSTFPRCQKKDPNIDTCILKATEEALKYLYPGIPSLGVFPLEPLTITELNIGNARGGSVSVDLQFRDLVLRGLDSIKLTSVKTDLNNYFIQYTGQLTKSLDLQGQYKANGRVLILPIHGNGDCHLKLDDVKANFTITGKERKDKNGVKYMDLKDFVLHFQTSRLHLYFHQLIGGPIGDNLNTILNESWEEILRDLQPGIEEALSVTFKTIAQRIFTKVPYDQIFL